MEKALQLLNAGDVVGMPTETVYGLAARIDRPEGIRKIFAVKERPFFDPLIVHVAGVAQARQITSAWPRAAQALSDEFWPGPLTLILPRAPHVNPLITSGLETVGVRNPRHPLAQELIRRAGPLAAPSANKFGRTSPTTAAHVRAEFGDQVFVLEGDAAEIGIESTVLSIDETVEGKTAVAILRAGAITGADVARVLNSAGIAYEFTDAEDKRAAPGQLKHHYMPHVPLIWTEGDWSDAEVAAELAPQIRSLPDVWEGVRLTKPQRALEKPARLELGDDPVFASRILYSELRRLAESGADHIYF